MRSILTAEFWVHTFERSLKTAAQSLLGVWTLDGVFNLIDTDWQIAGIAAATGAVYSLLTSIVSAPVSSDNTPSVV